jgi:hypothetical protein
MLLVSAMFGLPDRATAQPSGLAIQNVTLREDMGIITIVGSGFDRELAVTVDGQAAAVLPGGTDTQIEVLAPPSVLQAAGTYRLTVIDRLRKVGDAFVVASHAATVGVGSEALNSAPTAAPGAAPVPIGPGAVGLTATSVAPFAGGPSPMTVIEDSGTPFRTAIGYQALVSNTTGLYNTGTGYSALSSNTAGSWNTASGMNALSSNTTGTRNTASGMSALHNNTTGSFNTASGVSALDANTTGDYNTASGMVALLSNTTGSSNTANGYQALRTNTTGTFNTAFGLNALYSNTTAFYNTASGHSALYSNATGAFNTATGMNALYSNTTGANNAALGMGAGYNATTGSYNLFLGANVTGTAGDTNTIRIGLPYGGGLGQNKTFIAGIYGTQLSGTAHAVYIDADGQLGTVAGGGGGGGFLPMSQLEQQVDDQRKRLRDQETVNAELRARLAKLEALLQSVSARK